MKRATRDNTRCAQLRKVGVLVLLLSLTAKAKAQEVVVGPTSLLPATVSLAPATIQGIKVGAGTVTVLEYLRGVCRAEIGYIGLSQSGNTLTDSQKIELYKAQAMAAATYLAKRAKGATTIFVLNSEVFQTYLRRGDVLPEVNSLIDSAVNEGNVNTAVFFLGSLAETLYFNATNSGFTKNGNEAGNNGYFYNSELRRQITPEKITDGTDRAGMSQVGAKLTFPL